MQVWGYNTELYPDGCPIDNVWALTDDAWNAHVVMQDKHGRQWQYLPPS